MNKVGPAAYYLAIIVILIDVALTLIDTYFSVTVSDLNIALPVIAFLTLVGVILTLFVRTAKRGSMVVFVVIVIKLILLGPASAAQLILLVAGIIVLIAARGR